jgi:hypothetical protein
MHEEPPELPAQSASVQQLPISHAAVLAPFPPTPGAQQKLPTAQLGPLGEHAWHVPLPHSSWTPSLVVGQSAVWQHAAQA